MSSEFFEDVDVATVFDNYPPKLRNKLLALRELIFQVAEETPAIGELQETLKWGQPSYLTASTRSGSTLRIDAASPDATQYAIYFNCKTTLVEGFKSLYPDKFVYEGTRAIIFDIDDEPDLEALKHFIQMTLTYHLNKKRS